MNWTTETETKLRADLATPMRCAECDCEKGGADCNWIATPTPLDDPRVKALVEAATELEKQAKKAVNLGAVTGPHWTHLGLARMKMATALSALEGRT